MSDYSTPPQEQDLWIIEAPYHFLDQFCLYAGLGRDSAIPLVFTTRPDRFADARLTYPGAQCNQPETWLKVLALLYLHHIPFKLYKATGRQDRLTSLALLRPAMDHELETILGHAARAKIDELKTYKEMLDKAFDLISKFAADNQRFH